MDPEDVLAVIPPGRMVTLETGVVVTSIRPDSPAARAGFRPGDLVRELDQQIVRNLSDFDEAAAGIGPGRDPNPRAGGAELALSAKTRTQEPSPGDTRPTPVGVRSKLTDATLA